MDKEHFAEILRTAEAQRTPIAPLTAQVEIGVRDAYSIQQLNINRRLAEGRTIVGHKVGLTSLAMQRLLKVSEPDFGVILDDMVIGSGSHCQTDELLQPRAEGEVAFVLGEDLSGPGITSADVRRATLGVVPALEIIDSRIRDWKITLADTIADNASSARVVVGSSPTALDGLDLPTVGLVIEVNGEVADTGAGAAVLGDPTKAVAWLANTLAEFGTTLRAGQFVMAGSVHAAFDVEAGDHVRVVVGSGIGAIEVVFD
jgi:2-keto-4-pentenoate hydratase